MVKKIKATVSGRVQGVGFRMSTQSKAEAVGVKGYVRNLANGDVEIVAFGETQAVDELLQWSESGPPSAVVKDIKVESLAEVPEINGFQIRR